MKKVFISTVSALLVSSAVFADCQYKQEGTVDVAFKAYKTPLKIGVGGQFDDVKYINDVKSAKDLQALLIGSKVTIDTASVNSANEKRDKKLVTFFFDTMAQKGISAKIIDLKVDKNDADSKTLSGVVSVDIKMNNVFHEAQLKFNYENGVFKADGFIDLADYGALASLASINKACYELHQGKTWSDVAVSFTTNIAVDCK
ncbi:YceI family protein [Sulfurimonas sp. HSL3-2]|uniref:YceI family protein n=1 Tax=Hydrocurvibacter mobilis TaxID=3131936 RepID=UPI0031F99C8A